VSRLRHNILANYAGQAWLAIMGIAFVPIYLQWLGAEAFGLISFMISLQSVSQLFDFGAGSAINRELARRAHDGSAQSSRDLVRSFESLIWLISASIGLAIWLASTLIARHWLHPQSLSTETTGRAVTLMALAIATLWPSNFYASALSGLERQMTMNLVNAVFATLRSAGVLPVLYWISADVETFLYWYAMVGICHSLTLAVMLWRSLPAASRGARFSWAELHRTRRFAGGMFAISALSLALTQLDRLGLSALRPLYELGYYGLAISISAGLGRMVLPMFNALYPRFTRMVAAGEHDELISLYHVSNQHMAAVVAAVACVLVAFGRDLLFLWTGNPAIAAKVALPMAILVTGSAINGLMNIPYALQLAHGMTRYTVIANMIALTLAIPLGLWAIARYGMPAAACIWLMVNLGYFLTLVPLAHRKLLPEESAARYWRDILPPALAASVVALSARIILPPLPRDLTGLITLAAVSGAVLVAAVACSAGPRTAILRYLRNSSA
jgi:O-antigen/teichoic acid export membrane protein